MDSIYKAMSDKNRRKILEVLREKDMTVGEISRHFNITGASLSHHLDILKRSRLIVSERKGQHIEYSLNTSVFEETIRMFINLLGQK